MQNCRTAILDSLFWSLISGFSVYAQMRAVNGFVGDASEGEALADERYADLMPEPRDD
jgi:hypothetical protein